MKMKKEIEKISETKNLFYKETNKVGIQPDRSIKI